jgi:hypothetical protein
MIKASETDVTKSATFIWGGGGGGVVGFLFFMNVRLFFSRVFGKGEIKRK